MDKETEKRLTQQIQMNDRIPKVVLNRIRLNRYDSLNKSGNLPEVADEDDVPPKEDLQKITTCEQVQQELSFVNSMNEEERNAHVYKCLEMSLENKITPKNAFALQLIDCLSLLGQEKQDFSKMACTLDAGAKIYSNRVDALHQQVVKLANEVLSNPKQRGRNNNDNKDDDIEAIREKRRERKKNIIVSSESLQRKLKTKNPRSRFIEFEGVHGSITNRVKRDPRDLSYSLENNVPIFKNWDTYTPSRTGGTVPLPNITILREAKSQDENNDYLIEENVGSNDAELSQDSLGCEILASDPDDEDHFEEASKNHKETEKMETDTNEVGVIATAMKRLTMESSVNGIKSPDSCRLDAMKILFKEASEYHYLDMKNVHFWAGPEFWKRSNTATTKVKISKNKKEPVEILFDCDVNVVEDKWNSLFKKKAKLTNKTISRWKNNKLTLPMDLKVEMNLLFDLFNLSYNLVERKSGSKEQTNSFSGENTDNDSNNADDPNDNVQELSGSSINPDPLNSSFYEGVPGQSADTDLDTLNSAFYNAGLIKQETMEGSGKGRVLGITMSSEHHNSFDESTLIPAPKSVNFNPIKYSIRSTKVDMKHLKETMLGVINEEIENNMKERMAAPSCSNDTIIIIPETRFSHIIKKLPHRLEKRTARDLLVGMAFLALLIVAAENNLQLENTGDSDVIIRLEH